ncbi:MAG: hypothetical protein JO257_25585 [Deltaproteobacteria bacterium]|nr:hypothetical protein [Deltaproteobacteria bacterium]
MNRWIPRTIWLLVGAAGVYQVLLLVYAVGGRLLYPYDLEWMEGGMLQHALRIQTGHGIYTPPSIDFIPYLYTPLYPALLAVLGEIFGITYTLGRFLSVLSLLGIGATTMTAIAGRRYEHVSKGAAYAGVCVALGLFAAIYPFVEGWYDLVRADTMFLFMATFGIAAAPRWAATGEGIRGHGRTAAVAAILALSFFCKQTGIFYVGLGGAVVLAVDVKRAVTYVIVAGVLGLGLTAAANAASHGWFWVYVSEIHRAHDFNMDRFWKSFGLILWHFRALTIIVGVGLVATAATAIRTRRLPKQCQPLVLWSAAFVVSTVVGAVGWGTEFAHFNAYMPAFLHGAIAAGAALPALAACTQILWGDRPRAEIAALAAPALAGVALAITLVFARWNPTTFVPTAADVAAGDKLIARLRALDGEVWMPSHPWYLVLAGKQPHVHRMGVKDVTARQLHTPQQIIWGLKDALEKHRFSTLVLDDRDLFLELPLAQYYRAALKIPGDERPHVYTGAHVVPDTIWVPAVPATPPPGARMVFDFEQPTWTGWQKNGGAWGDGPVAESQPGQDLVLGATGHRFATSMHGGDASFGRVTSPPFTLDGTRLTVKLGGSTDVSKLRIELWVDQTIVRTAGVPSLSGDALHEVSMDVTQWQGYPATLVLVDDSATGHLDVDDVWVWDH